MNHTPRVMIDISGVSELREFSLAADLVLGSIMTLAEVMRLFLKVSIEHVYFRYTKKVYDHLDLVAHIPVRNVSIFYLLSNVAQGQYNFLDLEAHIPVRNVCIF